MSVPVPTVAQGDSWLYSWPRVEEGLLVLDPNFEDWSRVEEHPALDAIESGFVLSFSRAPRTFEVYAALSRRFEFREHLVWHDTQTQWVSNDLALRVTEDVLVFRVGKPRANMKVGPEVKDVEPTKKGRSAIGRWSQEERVYTPAANRHLTSLLSYPRDLSAPLGKWQKPAKLAYVLVSAFSHPGWTVLDPFCGSGTFLEAAMLQGKQAIGVELDEKHHAVAVERLRSRPLFAIPTEGELAL